MKHNKVKRHLLFLLILFLYLTGQNIHSNILYGGNVTNRPLVSVPFIFDGRILIPLKINDLDEIDIILDSGLPSRALILMHKETGSELGLKYVQTRDVIRGAGSGTNKAAHISRGENVSLSQVKLRLKRVI